MEQEEEDDEDDEDDDKRILWQCVHLRAKRIGGPLRQPALEVPQAQSIDTDMDILGPCRWSWH